LNGNRRGGGFLEATIAALRAGKRVALANRKSWSWRASLVRCAARDGKGEIVP